MQAAIEYLPNLLVLQNANADRVSAVAYLDQSLQGDQTYSSELRSRVQRMIRK